MGPTQSTPRAFSLCTDLILQDRAYVCSAQIETSLFSKKEATINHIAPFQVEVKGVFLKDRREKIHEKSYNPHSCD